MIDDLSYDFFREFARYEYCLKVAGLRENTRNAKASWKKYAAEVAQLFDMPQPHELLEAITYFEEYPPKKQIVKDDVIAWDETLPGHKSKAELILLLICRVRNNLFHGGKFNNQWFAPQRSEELLRNALIILKACGQAHEKVREAYQGNSY